MQIYSIVASAHHCTPHHQLMACQAIVQWAISGQCVDNEKLHSENYKLLPLISNIVLAAT
jgi:hypothetical protein